MHHISRIARAASLVCAGGLLASGAQAQAEAAKEKSASATLTRVEVTGSRIKRIESLGASPVSVIDRKDIEASGATSLDEVLRSMTFANGGSFGADQDASDYSSFGSSGISLRGLGTSSTLTLINGRRVAPFGFGSSAYVNTSAIPTAAIERIEILRDGGSAVYGADAIGGVINTILRRDYNGLELVASGSQTVYSDAEKTQFGATWGRSQTGDAGYNVLVNYSHSEQEPVMVNQRPRTADADFSEYGLPSYVSTYAGNVYSLNSRAGTSGVTFVAPLTKTAAPCPNVGPTGTNVAGRCIVAPVDITGLVNANYRDSLFISARKDFGGGFELFGDAALNYGRTSNPSFNYTSSSYSAYTDMLQDKLGQFGNAKGTRVNYLILAPGHPQNPLAANTFAGVRYRFDDVPRVLNNHTLDDRVTVGLRGEWAGWDWESALMNSRSRAKTFQTGLLNDSVFAREVLDANGYVKNSFYLSNPGLNDAGLMSRLYPLLVSRGKTGITSLDARAGRDLWELPGGPMSISVGAEVRRETVESKPDPILVANEIKLAGTPAVVSGGRTVSAMYAELLAPLRKGLEAEVAARIDSNSDFGNAFTPKVGLKWTVVPEHLVLRTTYSEGFRAPSLFETQIKTSTSFQRVQDPKVCPDFKNDTPGCQDFVEVMAGQDGNLKAETSKNFALGAVLQPTRNIILSVDGYQITRKNEVASPSAQSILNSEAGFPNRVIRDATGRLLRIVATKGNLGVTTVRGLDVQGQVNVTLDEGLGALSFSASYSLADTFKYSREEGAEELDYAGFYQRPKERMKASVRWTVQDWTVDLIWDHVGSYLRRGAPDSLACPYVGLATEPYCQIVGWGTGGLNVVYKGFKGLSLTLNVRNIENREPPLDSSRVGYFTGYSSSYHNALGRVVGVTAKYAF